MKQPKLTPEENAILLDFICDCFSNNYWDKSWAELYYHVMVDAHIWKALGAKVDDKFIKELKNEVLSGGWKCKRRIIRY